MPGCDPVHSIYLGGVIYLLFELPSISAGKTCRLDPADMYSLPSNAIGLLIFSIPSHDAKEPGSYLVS